MLASLFLIGASLTTPQMSVQAVSQTIVVDSDDAMARAVNRMVGGIVSYARWPDGSMGSARVMCVIGTPQLTDRMAPDVPGAGSVTVRRLAVGAATSRKDCDILFLGQMAVTDRRQLIAWVRGRPILTITDDDAACIYGAMFCVSGRAASLSFSVNLDAIGRGPLRIDPRVLTIGRSTGAPP
ncbi:YfiR family protein [Sphingopyxis sp.]|uniref:YfiR family protein n=1 Tax=Sphingopyxis sp. TaxID=1908224 RepID=UPI0025E4C0F7|nr:YfiR family protein [Sphingopyxis sp.]MBK6411813.1 YfiR family protein [Sphingopyxis sp.]